MCASTNGTGIGENNGRFFFWQIVSALANMHNKGIVHGDVKLDNILLDRNMTTALTDFGLSCSDNITQMTELIGTEDYLAPEVLSGAPYNGLQSDIYALGITLQLLVNNNNAI